MKRVPRNPSRPKPLSTIAKQFNQQRKLKKGIERAKVYSKWPQAVGNSLCQVSKPTAFRWDCLIVETKSAVISQELYSRKDMIIKKLNDLLGDQIVSNLEIHTNSSLFEK